MKSCWRSIVLAGILSLLSMSCVSDEVVVTISGQVGDVSFDFTQEYDTYEETFSCPSACSLLIKTPSESSDSLHLQIAGDIFHLGTHGYEDTYDDFVEALTGAILPHLSLAAYDVSLSAQDQRWSMNTFETSNAYDSSATVTITQNDGGVLEGTISGTAYLLDECSESSGWSCDRAAQDAKPVDLRFRVTGVTGFPYEGRSLASAGYAGSSSTSNESGGGTTTGSGTEGECWTMGDADRDCPPHVFSLYRRSGDTCDIGEFGVAFGAPLYETFEIPDISYPSPPGCGAPGTVRVEVPFSGGLRQIRVSTVCTNRGEGVPNLSGSGFLPLDRTKLGECVEIGY